MTSVSTTTCSTMDNAVDAGDRFRSDRSIVSVIKSNMRSAPLAQLCAERAAHPLSAGWRAHRSSRTAEIYIERIQVIEQTVEKGTSLNERKEWLLGCRNHLYPWRALAQPCEEQLLLLAGGARRVLEDQRAGELMRQRRASVAGPVVNRLLKRRS